jgi:predicted nuclease of predicted toxin-antitoxin system
MRFLIDMPLSTALTSWLTKRGHEAVHAQDLKLERASDKEILDIAIQMNSIIITADLDYPRMLANAKEECPGLILLRGGNYSNQEVIDRLKRVLEIVPAEDIKNSIIVIDKDRIRRRSLPIL